MPTDDVPTSLQESILAALIFDLRSGATIAAQVTPDLFDENYRDIAERVLAYRRRYREPPGLAHIDDLFGRELSRGRAPRLKQNILDLAELSKGLNGPYVVSRTEEFVRQRKYFAALLEANARWEQGGEELSSDLEAIFSSALKARTGTLDAGTFLDDTERVLKFFDKSTVGYSLGIDVLDRLKIFLVPKELILNIQPKGSGKSWSCVHVGLEALEQRARVLHVSCEMPESQVAQRYLQRIFAASTNQEKFYRTTLDLDRDKELIGFRTRKISPKWSFDQRGAKPELVRKLQKWGTRLGRLVIKEFPSGQLTVGHLDAYLDYLELEHKFIPNVLIADYPDLFKQDKNNLRISTGQTYVDLRGLLQKRNMAGWAPTQGNRSTLHGKHTRGDAVSEDVTKLFTADKVFSFSRTEEEKRLGLARWQIEYARGVADGTTIVMTQSYATGQFVLQAALMQKAYWDKLDGTPKDEDDD